MFDKFGYSYSSFPDLDYFRNFPVKSHLLEETIGVFNNYFKCTDFVRSLQFNYTREQYKTRYCDVTTISNKTITNFDGPALTITVEGFDKVFVYHLIDNKEIPSNIPVMYKGYCNSILNKEIITKVILEYNREYGLYLNEYMNYNKGKLLQNKTLYELNYIAKMFNDIERSMLHIYKDNYG